jgi:drug/metabolite transporter (DMT)-like permease
MPLNGFLFAFAAAFVHAGWNLLIARERDTHAATATALLVGCLVLAPAAAAVWRVQAAALPYAAASTLLELAYFALLAVAYQHHELSAVYPLARGSAPVLVLVGSAITLGSLPSAIACAGVLLVAGGVLAVRGVRWQGAPLALAVGACLAAYTVIDKQGVAHANPLAYLELVLVGPAIAYGFVVRRRVAPALRTGAPLAGVGMVGAYALTLAALQLAPAAAVSAVRESSVVIAVALAALILREHVTKTRWLGSIAVAIGVALVAAG